MIRRNGFTVKARRVFDQGLVSMSPDISYDPGNGISQSKIVAVPPVQEKPELLELVPIGKIEYCGHGTIQDALDISSTEPSMVWLHR